MSEHPAASGAVTCPQCGQADQIQRVSTVIDTGRQSTDGEIRTTTAGFATGAGAGVALTQGTVKTASTTALVNRLRLPNQTDYLLAWSVPALLPAGYVVFVLLSPLWLYLFGLVDRIDNPFLQILAGAPVVILALGMTMAIAGALAAVVDGKTGGPTRRARWDRASQRLRSGYYCFRDDVAFTPGERPRSPERYRDFCIQEETSQHEPAT